MAYKALYRTYRPQTFEEVAGQQHIVKTLKNALATGKIAHAYLFAGPRGTGKTTMAKLFAKALNCEEGIGHQCNECRNCLAVTDGSHPDVLELDAASNNGVDEIRDLIDKVKYGTILGRYKVYIIDEVHMLSTGAFNALLKTLEEPPEHVIFILATTEPHKILPTILSRCQRYDFEKVSDKDIAERIKVVLQEENIPYNEEAIKLIIKLADGGMRDALYILEKVLAYSGDRLNPEDVYEIFALESTEEKLELIRSILNHDVKDVLDRLNSYIGKGSDIKRLTEDLLAILKDTLIYNSSRNASYLDILKEEEAEEIAPYIDNKRNLEMIDVLMNALKDYKTVTSIVPIFEITLLKLASTQEERVIKFKTPSKEDKPLPIEEEVKPIEKPVEEKPIIEAPKPVEVAAPINNIEMNENVIFPKDSEGEESFKVDLDLMIKIMATSKKDIKGEILDGWKNIKRFITHPTLGKYASMLIDARPLVASQKIVVLEFQIAKNAEKINLKENQLGLQTLLNQVFGRVMFVYAVSRNESVELQGEYMNLLQLRQIPKASEINIEFIGE